MQLTLNRYELERLIRAQNVLLSPLEFKSRGDWLLACLEAVRSVIDADAGAAQDPSNPRFVISNEYSKNALEPYRDLLDESDLSFIKYERFPALGAWNRELIYRDELEVYLASRYYNEFIVPTKGFDGVGLSVATKGLANLTNTFSLIFHHNSTNRKFGERGLSLLKLLYPSFRGAIGVLSHFDGRVLLTSAAIDAVHLPVALYDVDGGFLHMTPELEELLGEDHANGPLQDALAQISSRLCTMTEAGEPSSEVEATVQTGIGRFKVRASWTPAGVFDTDRALLVSVEELDAVRMHDDRVRERFGLTPREVHVARLLARRKTNREIAQTLAISEHTARHHTERVLSKLGVHSRHEISDRLTESD